MVSPWCSTTSVTSMVTLSPTISLAIHLAMAARPQNSRCASLTSASSAKVARMASASKRFTAARWSGMGLGSDLFMPEPCGLPVAEGQVGSSRLTLPLREGRPWRVLTIGDFSRVTHLSIKTLRHYHEVGLLEPAAVDPGSGYRQYALAQIPVAQVIRRFRDLEMPVERVREVLAARDLATRNRIIAEHLGTLEKRLADAQAAVASLQGLLGAQTGPIAVELRVVPVTRALGIHATVTRAELLAWWRGAIGELEAVVSARAM